MTCNYAAILAMVYEVNDLYTELDACTDEEILSALSALSLPDCSIRRTGDGIEVERKGIVATVSRFGRGVRCIAPMVSDSVLCVPRIVKQRRVIGEFCAGGTLISVSALEGGEMRAIIRERETGALVTMKAYLDGYVVVYVENPATPAKLASTAIESAVKGVRIATPTSTIERHAHEHAVADQRIIVRVK